MIGQPKPGAPPSTKPGRVREFDALRGLAALAILAFHLNQQTLYWSRTGVDFFFVLSGFLITGLILRRDDDRRFLGIFYLKRSLRIFPIYYLTIGIVVAANLLRSTPMPMDGLPYYLTYTQNVQRYWFAETPPLRLSLFHTWTLAVEEQFYLIWPPLLCLVRRSMVIPLALAVTALAGWARWYGFDYTLLLTKCDGFALGGMLAALLSDPGRAREWGSRLRAAFATIALVTLAFLVRATWLYGEPIFWGANPEFGVSPVTVPLALNLLFFSVLGMVAVNASGPALAFLRFRPLCYIGEISYGLYLYHMIVFNVFHELSRKYSAVPTTLVVAAELAVSFALAMASWRFIEKPVLSLKDRLR